MAVFKCTECGNEVSDKASVCPHCGCPIEEIMKNIEENENGDINTENKVEIKEKGFKSTFLFSKLFWGIVCLVVVVCVFLIWLFLIKIPKDRAYKVYQNNYEEYRVNVDEYNKDIYAYNTIVDNIDETNNSIKDKVEEAQKVLDEGGVPFDSGTASELENAISNCRDKIVEVPSKYDEVEALSFNEGYKKSSASEIDVAANELLNENESVKQRIDEILAESNDLEVPDYSNEELDLETKSDNFIKSCEMQSIITNPSQDVIVNKLLNVDDIGNCACVTEDNDPNNLLGKDGGYTAQIYFSTKLLGTEALSGNKLIEEGTDAGGSIEIYENVEDAEKRDIYLGAFNNTLYDPGKHVVFGTMVIRVSTNLPASKQDELTDKIKNSILSDYL